MNNETNLFNDIDTKALEIPGFETDDSRDLIFFDKIAQRFSDSCNDLYLPPEFCFVFSSIMKEHTLFMVYISHVIEHFVKEGVFTGDRYMSWLMGIKSYGLSYKIACNAIKITPIDKFIDLIDRALPEAMKSKMTTDLISIIKSTYVEVYDEDETVVVTSRDDILNWCIKHKIDFNKFNQPVKIADGVTNCSFMFEDLESFNHSVVIPDSVTNCWGMFKGCKSFNSNVIIGNSVIECGFMFDCCINFNQPIIIPNSVTDCCCMFNCCVSFNQDINIPDSVTNCSGMFRNCKSLCSSVKLSKAAMSCDEMFYGSPIGSNLTGIKEADIFGFNPTSLF